jgi:hypothetical protein
MKDIDDARNHDDNIRWDSFHDYHALEQDEGDRQDAEYEQYIIEEELKQ